MTNPRRRSFTFSLRTLFVVVTLVGFALGSAVSQTQSRRAMSDRAASLGAVVYLTNEKRSVVEERRSYAPGIVRRLVGDRAVTFIILPHNFPDKSGDELIAAFPEASFAQEHITGDQTPDPNRGALAAEYLRRQREGRSR